ncbi:MAG TPA: hypothetical protein DCQ64_10085 [Candidatus Rokubacteria bacterium]|nr:hypothetical protein [Candidatus Rokubacteria bacterium]
MADLTVPGLLVAAIGALSTVVTLLWRTLEKRTESLLSVNRENLVLLTRIQDSLATASGLTDLLSSEHDEQTKRLIAHGDATRREVAMQHAEQTKRLYEIRSAIVMRQRLEPFANGDPTPTMPTMPAPKAATTS